MIPMIFQNALIDFSPKQKLTMILITTQLLDVTLENEKSYSERNYKACIFL